jgi:hypothetical protein
MNISLLKHGFQVWASWRLKKMFKVSTFSFHAGIAGDRLLEPYFLPPHLTGAVYCDFLWNVLPELLLQDVHLQTRTHLCYAWWCSNTFYSCILAILVQHVSRTMSRMRTTKSMACSFSWFKSLIFVISGASEAYSICYWSPCCPWLATTNTEQFGDDLCHLEFSSKSGGHFSDMQQPAFRLKFDMLGTFSLILRLPWLRNCISEGLCV